MYNKLMISIQKRDGFKDEKLIVIPTEFFASCREHPLVKTLFLTDVGFFPEAKNHYRERKEGIEEFILIYCTDGKGVIELANKKYELHGGEVFCIPAYAGHRYYADQNEPWSILWVHFKGENAQYFPLTEKRIVQLETPKSNDRLQSLFSLLISVLERNYTLGNFIYTSQLLSVILSEIYLREKASDIDKQNQYLTKAIRYMYNNMDVELTLDDIADYMKLSKSYLNSIFKTFVQRSPVDFYIHLKMQQACKYFKMTNMFVYEVSKKLGYQDPYYFSRIFKKVIGVSPREYCNSSEFSGEKLSSISHRLEADEKPYLT
ncbi:AraC family transcriptional regulator [Caproiciproducens sp.]|uniref:AraC family transcriptional regulator n=1 Tax=Caproiciproducens sp. TaxID=1954376 RepID=UPI0028A28768|nr:helix-turn-helix domain-containing protein [Caproiciproducens sp.]